MGDLCHLFTPKIFDDIGLNIDFFCFKNPSQDRCPLISTSQFYWRVASHMFHVSSNRDGTRSYLK